MTEGSDSRFIPIRRQQLVQACAQKSGLNGQQTRQWWQFAEVYSSLLHFEFHRLQEDFKAAYAAQDPNADTRAVELINTNEKPDTVQKLLERVLDRANYDQVSQQELQQALSQSSLFDVRLQVDFDEFDEVLLYCRGASERCETLSSWFGLRKREVSFINFERVVVYLKFRQQLNAANPLCRPGATLLKLFQNVPRADLEMLFPNTRVGMRLIDKLMIGIPAAIGGGVVVSTKLGGSLILLASLAGYWLGAHDRPVHLDQAALLALVAGLGALGVHFWKQFNNFKNRKLRFVQTLIQNLYFKNLDNNAGVFYRLLDEAEEEEGKEALLAYFFLWQSPEPIPEAQLDAEIERWLVDQIGVKVNFEIDDALRKLREFGLIEQREGAGFSAVAIAAALQQLDAHWDGLFAYANGNLSVRI